MAAGCETALPMVPDLAYGSQWIATAHSALPSTAGGLMDVQLCHALLNVGSTNYYHSTRDVWEMNLLGDG
jgi:hypothetical protein